MKPSDRYHKWVEWSDEDGTYLGQCPDLITGIHGDDPVRLYAELCEVVDDVIDHFAAEGRTLPPARIRPLAGIHTSASPQIPPAAEIRQHPAPYDEDPEDGSPRRGSP